MKLMKFSQPAISLILLSASFAAANACGPYPPTIPTPRFFTTEFHRSMSDYDREENLRLWQSLTSERIPLEDIEEAVYRDSYERFTHIIENSSEKTTNKFYAYLINTGNSQIISFLDLAKRTEKEWRKASSPWYYPSRESYDYTDDPDFLDCVVDECKDYEGELLRDRYGLQGVRALFASRRYADCIEFYDSYFADIPSDNLMKRMAQRYVAGCMSRLGDKMRADTIFAKAGDIWSLSRFNPLGFMVEINPDAPQIMDYIRSKADTATVTAAAVYADRLLRNNLVKNRGDWELVIAFFNNEYKGNPYSARAAIYKAMNQSFSSEELKNLARAYKMRLDARTSDLSCLLADLKWAETLADPIVPGAYEWVERVRNIIYVDCIPNLWNKRDYATALLLAGYADALHPETSDYGSLFFQMMGSLSSSQLAAAYEKMKSHTPLYDFLRRNIRQDSDFYIELIGTLALREENYEQAVRYLSRVTIGYQTSMNLFTDGWLNKDPFIAYPSRWNKAVNFGWEWPVTDCKTNSRIDYKLNFANRMMKLKKDMQSAPTADQRGIARLWYAIGRRNSFEECWSLTQYWRGYVDNFEPGMLYDERSDCHLYDFLFDYHFTIGHEKTEFIYDKEKEAALAMLQSDEAKAEAQYILGNLKTIIKLYPKTRTAQNVKTSCDNWRTWL